MARVSGLATHPRWAWPMAFVVVILILATLGRQLVAGLFAAIAVLFVLALVCALVWGLLAMAGPGPRGALHGLRRSWRGARITASNARQQLVHQVGQAPRRSPPRVVNLVAHQLAGETFELPTGPVAYPHLRVLMHPETLRMLDRWMPIGDVAATWAEYYIHSHRATRWLDESVTVSVGCSQSVPRGRALVDGAFRADLDGPDTWATAQCSAGPDGHQVARRGRVMRLGPDGPADRSSAADEDEVHDQAIRLDTDATICPRKPHALRNGDTIVLGRSKQAEAPTYRVLLATAPGSAS